MPTLSQAGPLIAPVVLAAGWVLQGTVPTGKVWMVSGFDLVNKHASTSDTIMIALGAGSTSNLILAPRLMVAGADWPRYRQMALKAGTTIYTNAATGGLVVFTLQGIEITA